MQRCQKNLSKTVNVWHMMVGEDTGHSAPYCIQTFLGKFIFAIYEHLCTDFIAVVIFQNVSFYVVIACNYGRMKGKGSPDYQDSGIQPITPHPHHHYPLPPQYHLLEEYFR